jgi:hypothetical protein
MRGVAIFEAVSKGATNLITSEELQLYTELQSKFDKITGN